MAYATQRAMVAIKASQAGDFSNLQCCLETIKFDRDRDSVATRCYLFCVALMSANLCGTRRRCAFALIYLAFTKIALSHFL